MIRPTRSLSLLAYCNRVTTRESAPARRASRPPPVYQLDDGASVYGRRTTTTDSVERRARSSRVPGRDLARVTRRGLAVRTRYTGTFRAIRSSGASEQRMAKYTTRSRDCRRCRRSRARPEHTKHRSPTIRASWRVALVFHRERPPSIDRLVKCPRATGPAIAIRTYVRTCPFRRETMRDGRERRSE